MPNHHAAVVLLSAGLMTLLTAQAGNSQGIINRRASARRGFQSTPESIYHHYCAHCHGDDGTGAGRLWPADLSPSPADLTTLGANKQYLSEAIYKGSSLHGKSSLCPPWQWTIPRSDIERLALYLTSLADRKAAPSASAMPASFPDRTRSTFPGFLAAVLAGEVIVLTWLITRKRKQKNAIPKNPAVRG